MKIFARLLPVLLLSCSTITPVIPKTDEVTTCAKEAAQDVFFTLQPKISTLLVTSNSPAEFAKGLLPFVAEYGITMVTCVVDMVRDRNAQSAVVASGDEKDLHERSAMWAAQWIEEHGAKIER